MAQSAIGCRGIGLRRRGYSILLYVRSFFREIGRSLSPLAGLARDFSAVKIHFFAAGIAFYAFLSLLPMTIGLITVLHLTLGRGDFDEMLHDAILQMIPVMGESETGETFVNDFLSHASSNAALTSSISGLVLFVSTLGVFGAIRESVNTVWGLQRRRSFFKQRVVDAGFMSIASAILIVSLVVSGFFAFIEEVSHVIGFDTEAIRHTFVHTIGVILPWMFTFVVLTVTYWWLPNTKVSIRQIAPVTALATIVFELVKLVFITYLHHLSDRLLSIYGGLAALMMFFVFIYIESIVMLVGAMLCGKWTRYLEASKQKLLIPDPTRRIDRLSSRVTHMFAVRE